MANRIVEVTFDRIPETVDGFCALPQASLTNEFDVAALTVLALCVYPVNREQSLAMLDVLKGPKPLTESEKQFIRDRFMTCPPNGTAPAASPVRPPWTVTRRPSS